MKFTYTKTLTKQERMIRDLIDAFDSKFENNEVYYIETMEDGQKILYGDDFQILKKKEKGFYNYVDNYGVIETCNNNYRNAKIILEGCEPLYLTQFFENPEVEIYANSVKEKLKQENQKILFNKK